MDFMASLIQDTYFRARTVSEIEKVVYGTAHCYLDKDNDRADVSILGPNRKVYHYYEFNLSTKLFLGILDSKLLAMNAVNSYRAKIFHEFFK